MNWNVGMSICDLLLSIPLPPPSALDPLLLVETWGDMYCPQVPWDHSDWQLRQLLAGYVLLPLQWDSWMAVVGSHWLAASGSHREAIDWRCLQPAWRLRFEPSYQKLIWQWSCFSIENLGSFPHLAFQCVHFDLFITKLDLSQQKFMVDVMDIHINKTQPLPWVGDRYEDW